MEKIIRPKHRSYCSHISIWSDPNHRGVSEAWSKMTELDKSFVGTFDYMGFCYFWDHEVKHQLRDATTKERKLVHDCFVLNNVPLKTDEISKEKYFETNAMAQKIVDKFCRSYKRKY